MRRTKLVNGFAAFFKLLRVNESVPSSLTPLPFLLTTVTTSWHTEDDVYRAPPIDRSILPTAPRAAREPNVDRSRLPRSPPYTAFLGNLPYDVTEDSIKDFFRGLSVSPLLPLHSWEKTN